MTLSDNQMAQRENDTSANEANRIRERESAVKHTYLSFVYMHGTKPSAAQMSILASKLCGEYLGEEYVLRICERNGYELA
jgi:hypothetical protein